MWLWFRSEIHGGVARIPDVGGMFQERMDLLDTFRQSFFYLFRDFLKERNDSKTWKETKVAMRKWVSERSVTA